MPGRKRRIASGDSVGDSVMDDSPDEPEIPWWADIICPQELSNLLRSQQDEKVGVIFPEYSFR